MLHMSRRPLTASTADRALFVGREHDQSRALGAINDHLNVFVTGERGSGRTSFLAMLAHACPRPTVKVRAAPAATASELLAAIAAAADTEVAAPTEGHLTEEDVLDILGNLVRTVGADPVIVIDDADPAPFSVLFGAFRDVLWERPEITWVVAGDGGPISRYLRAPADAFFQTVINLVPLPPDELRDLLERRAWGEGEREDHFRDAIVPTVVQLAERGPLRGNPGTIIQYAAEITNTTAGTIVSPHTTVDHPMQQAWDQSESHGRAYEALMRLGSAHSGDPKLLDELGWSRAHTSRILNDLAEADLVSVSRVGRRRVYATRHP